jgi:hypothetical protein
MEVNGGKMMNIQKSQQKVNFCLFLEGIAQMKGCKPVPRNIILMALEKVIETEKKKGTDIDLFLAKVPSAIEVYKVAASLQKETSMDTCLVADISSAISEEKKDLPPIEVETLSPIPAEKVKTVMVKARKIFVPPSLLVRKEAPLPKPSGDIKPFALMKAAIIRRHVVKNFDVSFSGRRPIITEGEGEMVKACLNKHHCKEVSSTQEWLDFNCEGCPGFKRHPE